MTDVFHSCDITPNGISIKVLRDGVGHRSAIGVGDYATKADFIAAAADFLEATLGPDLALVAANLAAKEDDKDTAVNALNITHAAEIAKLNADLAILGTKEEAASMRKTQAIAAAIAEKEAADAKLAELLASTEPVDIKP
jgi:hypothetical protein